MPYLIIIGLAMAFSFLFPRAATAAAWILNIFFIFPFFTLAAGTLGWALANFMEFSVSWTSSLLMFGVPFALMLNFWCLKD